MLAARVTRTPTLRSALAFAIGIATHVVLDAIPHADYGYLPRRMIAAIIIGEGLLVVVASLLILGWRTARADWLAIFFGVVGATLPDARFGADILLPHAQAVAVTRATYWFHSWFHASEVNKTLGWATQVSAAVLLLGSLALFPRVAANKNPG